MSEHMQLWESVRTPDPSLTKGFSRTGGFKGTAISPMWLIRRATEEWGPCGGAWGFSIVKEEILTGGPIFFKDKDGHKTETIIGHDLIHVSQVEVWYPPASGGEGKVQGIGQTEFVGENKYGVFTDEEAPKKSRTDALGNALKFLGFGADVFMGLFDDSKYVNDARAAYAGNGTKAARPEAAPTPTVNPTDPEARRKKHFPAMARSAKEGGIDALGTYFKECMDKEDRAACFEEKDRLKAVLLEQAAAQAEWKQIDERQNGE